VCAADGENVADAETAEIAFQYTDAYTENIFSYVNNIPTTEGGTHETGFKIGLTKVMNDWARKLGLLKEKDQNLIGDDYREGLTAVLSVKMQNIQFEGQTKTKLGNTEAKKALEDIVTTELQKFFESNQQIAEIAIKKGLLAAKVREAARKEKELTRARNSIDNFHTVGKLKSCTGKKPENNELFIVEGDSALGSVKLSRDGEFQGIMPVRGKILNCLKADYPRIFKSEIITDLLKVLGCGVEVPGKFVKDLNAFDINNLRWNKVILCTDADVDGFQIRTLILTMIYRLCPTLIREGYVYIAETPLFEITCGEKTWFAYTDKEKNDIVKTLEGKRYKVDRSKGLGENDPEMMWLTTMNPETRRLIKVMPEDAEATAHSFDLLLGDNLQGRKDHIAENGYKYLEMIDVS